MDDARVPDVDAAKTECNRAQERRRVAEDALAEAQRQSSGSDALWDAILDQEPVEAQQPVGS